MAPATPTPPAWTVTSQMQRVAPGSTGRFVDGVEVYFTTRAGHQGSVFIEKTRYTPDAARELIAAAAAQMDAVGNLSG